jgi:hypothetical protein
MGDRLAVDPCFDRRDLSNYERTTDLEDDVDSRTPIVMTAHRLHEYEWPLTTFDWLTVVRPEGRYQLRIKDRIVRNAGTGDAVRLGLAPEPRFFRPTRDWAARAVRAARALVPGF